MALLFMEGFDAYDDYNALTSADHYVSSSAPTIWTVPTTNRNLTGRSLRQDSSNYNIVFAIEPSTTDTYYAGFAYNVDDTFQYNYWLIEFLYGQNSIRNAVRFNSDGTLSVYRGNSTSLGTTTKTLTQGQWHYIVVKIKVSDTVGTVELWIDGIKELNLTSQDTNPDTGTDITKIRFQTYYTSWNLDDIYVGDTSGTDMTDEVGEVHIEMLTPNANGNRNNFTRVGGGSNNYEAVDEGAVSDDDTTYNHSATATDAELYGTTSITQTIDTIYAVQVQASVRKEDAGYRTVNTIIRSSTSETDSSAKAVGTEYTRVHGFAENDPNGGGNWTESAVNACEVGIEIAS